MSAIATGRRGAATSASVRRLPLRPEFAIFATEKGSKLCSFANHFGQILQIKRAAMKGFDDF